MRVTIVGEVDGYGLYGSIMKRSQRALWRCAPGLLVLARTDGLSCVVTGPGAKLWELLENDLATAELVASLAEAFGADPQIIERDIGPVIHRLMRDGFIDG